MWWAGVGSKYLMEKACIVWICGRYIDVLADGVSANTLPPWEDEPTSTK